MQGIERHGIDAVPDDERRGTAAGLFWPWAGSNLSLFGVAFGIYVMALGLDVVRAAAAGVVGYVASFALVGWVSVAGARTGMPTMALSRVTFGRAGNVVPAFASYVSNVGWETVLVTLCALGASTIVARVASVGASGARVVTAACFGVAAAVTIAVGVYGHAVIMRVQQVLTWTFALLTLGYVAIVWPRLHVAASAFEPRGGPLVVLGGVVFAMTLLGLGWVNCGADYSRYLPATTPASSIVTWTTVGGALPPALLLLLGVVLAGADPDAAAVAANDPVGALAAKLPTWFLVPYLVSALGGFLAGAIMDIYSSSLSLLALGAPLRRHQAVVVDGALMTAGGFYLLFVSPSFLATFQAFLAIIGVVMAAWVAVFLVDSSAGRRGDAPRAATSSLAIGSLVGLGLVTSSDPYLAHVVGFLLPASARSGTFGAANVGVLAALVLAGACHAVLRRVLRS